MLNANERVIPRRVLLSGDLYGPLPAVEEYGTAVSYRQLADAMMQAAAAFLRHGVRRGDRIAVWAPNSLNWIVAALGAQAAGAILVPLNTRFKGVEAATILRSSGARILLTVSEFLGTRYLDLLADERLPDLQHSILLDKPGVNGWQEFLATGTDLSEAHGRLFTVTGEDISDIIFTSGTTGTPKGAMTTHAQNLQMYDYYANRLGLRTGDRYLIVNPFFHTFGYKAGWLSIFLKGATALPHAVFSAEEVLKRITKERISVLPGPPTLYQSLLACPSIVTQDLSSLRLAITGAAAIPPSLIRRMREELGFKTILTAYGLSETGGVVTISDPNDDEDAIATTSGRPIDGVDVCVTDDRGRAVSPGVPGEVWVRGYCIMKGYYRDEKSTTQAIDNEGWLHTGDIGVMRVDGSLTITDRKKDMFIVGGFNCYPAEIEKLMHGHKAISQVAVIGVPDERLGEVGKAFVVLKPDQSCDASSLIAWCRENMANFKVPRWVEFRTSLPTNASGKIQKEALRQEPGVTIQAQ